MTYVCELCFPWNRVVREYQKPALFLLSIFEGSNEFSSEEYEAENDCLFRRPEVYRFGSVEDILKFLDSQEENDPSFEGFVLRDRFNNRLKIKSKSYLKLSYYFGNRTAFHPRHLIVLVHDGDEDEILTYYPNVRPAFDKVKEKIDKHLELLWILYKENVHKNKRSFHESVAGVPLYSVLESLHKQKGVDATPEDLFQIWIRNEDKVLRELFGVTASEHNLRHRSNYQEMTERNRQNKEKRENHGH